MSVTELPEPPMPTEEERVAAGAALLDAAWARDDGWAHRIDVDRLRLVDCERCILGQLYGDYWAGINALGLEGGADNGFYVAGPGRFSIVRPSYGDEWNRLSALWLAEIATRVAA